MVRRTTDPAPGAAEPGQPGSAPGAPAHPAEAAEQLLASAMRACGLPPRASHSPNRLGHLTRDLACSVWTPGSSLGLGEVVRQGLEQASRPGTTPREARWALAQLAGRHLHYVAGGRSLAPHDRERLCVLLALLARADRQEFGVWSVPVPVESALVVLRAWITHEGVDHKVTALMRSSELGSLRHADEFVNSAEACLRAIDARSTAARQAPVAPAMPPGPSSQPPQGVPAQPPATAQARVPPPPPEPPPVEAPNEHRRRPCDQRALAQYERALELRPDLAARGAKLKDIYNVVKNEVHDAAEDGALAGFVSWRRFLSRARRDPTAPKRSPRRGRVGRSVVRPNEL